MLQENTLQSALASLLRSQKEHIVALQHAIAQNHVANNVPLPPVCTLAMAKRTATLTPKPSKGAKRAKSALRTEPLSSEALFTLGGEHALVEAEVLRRPSQRTAALMSRLAGGGGEATRAVPSLDLR